MYVDPAVVDETTLYQGDILDNFPFQILDGQQPIKKTASGFEIDGNGAQEASLQAVESRRQKVMILSQNCDLQRRKNVIICPVHELAQFTSDNTLNADSLRDIRGRRNYYLFYLPAFGSLQESIADLQTMVYVPRSVVASYIEKRSVSLSDFGRHHLSWTLAVLFGRPAVE